MTLSSTLDSLTLLQAVLCREQAYFGLGSSLPFEVMEYTLYFSPAVVPPFDNRDCARIQVPAPHCHLMFDRPNLRYDCLHPMSSYEVTGTFKNLTPELVSTQ